jgi:hypothetical protein
MTLQNLVTAQRAAKDEDKDSVSLQSGDVDKLLRTIKARLGELDVALEEFAASDPDEVPGGWLLNTSFEGRLAQAAAADSAGAGQSGQISPPDAAKIVQNSNSALIALDVYVPKMPRWANWRYHGHENALFVAPIARLQFLAIPSGPVDLVDKEGEQVESRPLFRHLHTTHAYGVRFGHFLLDPRRQTIAPELISFLDLTAGKFSNLHRPKAGAGPDEFDEPWRVELHGRFKIPQSPIYVGFTGNIGQGQDDMRLFIGTRFDLSKVLAKVLPQQ